MTKNTMANKLPRKLIQKMEIVGEQIKLARLRRNLSMAQVAERATCSEDGQQEGTAYAIDVDPENGKIEWVITLEDLPGGNVFTLSFSPNGK